MNKKIIILIVFIVVIVVVALIFFIQKNNNKINSNTGNTDNTATNLENNNATKNDNTIKNKVEDMEIIYIKVNNQILDVELEDNLATKELKEKLKDRDIIVQAKEYGGFEKVGNLGFSLPRDDRNVTTTAGDIVLYQGNQISLFYDSNSWNYTKLGKMQNIDANELKNILGSGDVTVILTVSR